MRPSLVYSAFRAWRRLLWFQTKLREEFIEKDRSAERTEYPLNKEREVMNLTNLDNQFRTLIAGKEGSVNGRAFERRWIPIYNRVGFRMSNIKIFVVEWIEHSFAPWKSIIWTESWKAVVSERNDYFFLVDNHGPNLKGRNQIKLLELPVSLDPCFVERPTLQRP